MSGYSEKIKKKYTGDNRPRSITQWYIGIGHADECPPKYRAKGHQRRTHTHTQTHTVITSEKNRDG
jgi:hypothetical protein